MTPSEDKVLPMFDASTYDDDFGHNQEVDDFYLPSDNSEFVELTLFLPTINSELVDLMPEDVPGNYLDPIAPLLDESTDIAEVDIPAAPALGQVLETQITGVGDWMTGSA